MPIYEYACENDKCYHFGRRKQSLLKSFSSPDPCCPKCGTQLRRSSVSQFSVVFSKPMSAYDQKTSQGGGVDGHWAWRKNTESGKPERVWIDSFAAQREFCRQEGLINPTDINPNCFANQDGTRMETAGIPGQWANTPEHLLLQGADDDWI